MAIVIIMSEKENIENRRKKLILRSGHRGTKEMDLIMGTFAEQNVPGFSEEELDVMVEQLRIYQEIIDASEDGGIKLVSGACAE